MIQFTNEEKEILNKASDLLISKLYAHEDAILFNGAAKTKQYVQFKYVHVEQEVFSILFLDSQHKLIEHKEMFFGTINSANIHIREVAKHALSVNASSLILVHNHPSLDETASDADIKITRRLIEALNYFDISILDHLIVGLKSVTSLAEKGYM